MQLSSRSGRAARALDLGFPGRAQLCQHLVCICPVSILGPGFFRVDIQAAKDGDESAALALAKIAGQKSEMEEYKRQMQMAIEAWPLNPRINEQNELFSSVADVMVTTLNELDSLLSQGNHREIMRQQGRFIAAVQTDPQPYVNPVGPWLAAHRGLETGRPRDGIGGSVESHAERVATRGEDIAEVFIDCGANEFVVAGHTG